MKYEKLLIYFYIVMCVVLVISVVYIVMTAPGGTSAKIESHMEIGQGPYTYDYPIGECAGPEADGCMSCDDGSQLFCGTYWVENVTSSY
jgi:hypothetical protein